jgi:signal transduction histidine kinase
VGAQLARQDIAAPERLVEELESIESTATRASALTKQLLTFARREQARAELAKAEAGRRQAEREAGEARREASHGQSGLTMPSVSWGTQREKLSVRESEGSRWRYWRARRVRLMLCFWSWSPRTSPVRGSNSAIDSISSPKRVTRQARSS